MIEELQGTFAGTTGGNKPPFRNTTARETAMCVTRDVLTVETQRWFFGDSEFDMLGWHDWLLGQSVTPISPYNPRNTDDPPGIEYNVEGRIKQNSDTTRFWQRQFDKTHAERSRIKTAVGVCKGLGFRTPAGLRSSTRQIVRVDIAFCFRLTVALVNHHQDRGNDVASPIIALSQQFCTTTS